MPRTTDYQRFKSLRTQFLEELAGGIMALRRAADLTVTDEQRRAIEDAFFRVAVQAEVFYSNWFVLAVSTDARQMWRALEASAANELHTALVDWNKNKGVWGGSVDSNERWSPTTPTRAQIAISVPHKRRVSQADVRRMLGDVRGNISLSKYQMFKRKADRYLSTTQAAKVSSWAPAAFLTY